LIVAEVPGADAQTLRKAMDVIRAKRPDAAMLLAARDEDKLAFLAAVPKPLIDKGLKAGDWVREVAKAAGGGGGGKPDMAQAGGKDPEKLGEALAVARGFATAKLS
jgi:alanyl-tRNA synthetase